MLNSHSHRAAIVVAILTLVTAGAAVAATPLGGKKYAGTTSQKVNGYAAPVKFTVSGNRKQLRGFQYGDVGCFVSIIPAGNPYLQAAWVHRIGTIAVSKGTFSIKNVKTVYSVTVAGGKLRTVTTTTVSGTFKTAKKATGKITLFQSQTAPGLNHSCPKVVTRTFTATTH